MNYSTSFTEFEYKLYNGLLIVEFILLIVTLFIFFMIFYLIIKVQQFHLHLIGLFGNITVAFLIALLSRTAQIIASNFNPYLG